MLHARLRWGGLVPMIPLALLGGGCTMTMPDGGGDGTPAEARWRMVLEELPAALLSIAGTSDDDVYTVGADPGDGAGPYVLHFDGQSWRRLLSGGSGDLWWISDRPLAGRWFMAGAGGLILAYDPADDRFEELETPGSQTLFGIWGASAEDIWAVGGDLANVENGGVLWRFDGRTWRQEDLSAIDADGVPTLFKVWGRSATEVYVCGERGTALRYNGTTWERLQTDTMRRLFTIHGNQTQVVAVGGFSNGVIDELENGSFVDRADAGTPQLNGVFLPQDGRGVGVGIEVAVVFRAEDGTWEVQDTGLDSIRDFHATWVDPAGGIWAVGGNVTLEPLNAGILAHYGPTVIPSELAETPIVP